MSEAALPACSAPLRPVAPQSSSRVPQKQPAAFGDLLGENEKQPARRHPPSCDGPRLALPPRGPASPSLRPPESEPAASGAAVGDGEKEERFPALREPPEKEDAKEAPRDWTGPLQAVALPPQQPVRMRPAAANEASANGERPAGMGDAAAGMQPGTAPQSLNRGLPSAAAALRQKLPEAGEAQKPSSAGIAGAVLVEPDAAAGADGARGAANRRSRDAVASLGLFEENRRPSLDKAAAEPARTKPESREPGLAAEEKPPADRPPETAVEDSLPAPQPFNGGATGEAPRPPLPPKAFGALLAAHVSAQASVSSMPALPVRNAPAKPLQTLEVRLHPAELGSVTARLRISEGQLSVEITADSVEGKESLSAQEAAIRVSLEALGFRVDRLVVQHLPGQGAAPPDPSRASPGSGEGGQASAGGAGGTAGEGAGGSGKGAGSGGNSGGSGGTSGAAVSPRPSGGGAGLFI